MRAGGILMILSIFLGCQWNVEVVGEEGGGGGDSNHIVKFLGLSVEC